MKQLAHLVIYWPHKQQRKLPLSD